VAATLREHPEVRDAAVIARPSGAELSLVAYACRDVRSDTAPDTAPDDDELLAFLRDRLPSYMVPAEVVVLPALPLTEHGKVDHGALAALAPHTPVEHEAQQLPRTPTEERVAQLASTLLDNRPVGREDDFFRIGGHSLLAARLVAQVNDAFGADVPMALFLQRPTVASLAGAVAVATAGPQTGRGPVGPSTRRAAARLLSELDQLSDEEVESLLRDSEGTEVQP
jgi:acyl carrier protein